MKLQRLLAPAAVLGLALAARPAPAPAPAVADLASPRHPARLAGRLDQAPPTDTYLDVHAPWSAARAAAQEGYTVPPAFPVEAPSAPRVRRGAYVQVHDHGPPWTPRHP